jgi:hypothetical protein
MADPVMPTLTEAAGKPGLLARLFPPLTPAQAAVMAQVKLPCC